MEIISIFRIWYCSKSSHPIIFDSAAQLDLNPVLLALVTIWWQRNVVRRGTEPPCALCEGSSPGRGSAAQRRGTLCAERGRKSGPLADNKCRHRLVAPITYFMHSFIHCVTQTNSSFLSHVQGIAHRQITEPAASRAPFRARSPR